MRRRWGFRDEIKRKGIHILSLLFLLAYIVFGRFWGEKLALFGLVVLLIIFLELDFARVEWQTKIPFIHQFHRPREKHSFGGQIFFLVAVIISLAVFDFRIAATAILMTTFGDMASALVGKTLGKTWIMRHRALEGCVAEFVVDLIIGFLLLGWANWFIVLPMALVATIVETLATKLDDNLLIPIFSGFTGQVIVFLVYGVSGLPAIV